jgi:RES domain
MPGAPRDLGLIDALEALSTRPFRGTVWRVTRDGRDPTIFAAGGNRWDDGSFDVLYTALEREGAIAEMRFHLSRGQPVFPSKVRYRLHELSVDLNGVFDLTDWGLLNRLGLDQSGFGRMPYLDRESEYRMCQRIEEAVHFLGGPTAGEPSGFLVPNARRPGANLVLLGDYVLPEALVHHRDHGLIDWSKSGS